MWAVRHFWPVRASFAFNFYRYWKELILRQPGGTPVTILSQEGVTQGDHILMVLYGITLVPLAKDLKAADPGLLSPFYAENVLFDGSAQKSA